MKPVISIIVVCFNAGDKLQQTLQSILRQSYGDYEVIVKDAGSTDGSLSKLPSDPRIRVITSKDSGIYDGMNQALDEAKGQYIYFLNCGDVFHEEHTLSTVMEEIAKKADGTPTIFYGDVIELQTGQRVCANPNMTHLAMFRYLPCHQACIYTRDLFCGNTKQNIPAQKFALQYKVRADYEHFLRCVITLGAKACYLPIVIADYEGGGFSETESGREQSRREHVEITEKYFTKQELRKFRGYLILTMQPLREKLAQGEKTAALYDGFKNMIYRFQRGKK